MRSVTEFASFTLNAVAKTKAALTAEGKTPEEVQTSLGESLKLEGDKLKYLMAALDVAEANKENLKRVLVVALAEGENAPAKSVKVEEMHFVPDFHVDPKRQEKKKEEGKGKGKGGGKGRGGRDVGKESPWGLSPEQKLAKQGKGPLAQKAAGDTKPGPAAKPNPS
jgi:hypothetical protein